MNNNLGESGEGRDFKQLSPMTGLQIYHQEWEVDLHGVNQMEVEDNEEVVDDYRSPGLFVEDRGLGSKFLIGRRGGNLKIDLLEVKKHFSKFGHVWYAPWEGKKGIHIRFASMELLKEAYDYCIRKTNTLEINFCMLRGKASFGGVLQSEHPYDPPCIWLL